MKTKLDLKKINSLASGKSQLIKFIHEGKECRYYTTVKELSGDRMSAFNNDAPSINEERYYILKVIKSLRKKAQIISDEGDYFPLNK